MRWGLLSLLLIFTIPANQSIVEELRAPEKVASYVRTSEQMDTEEIVPEEADPVQVDDPGDQDLDDQDVVDPEPEAESVVYYGTCRITFYCNCAECCGQWAGGGTASGTTPTPGRTVANGSLPFGTKVLIDGQEYIVEDRGVGSDQFDIFVGSHQEALDRGLYYADVYLEG